ncbi:waprin-like protein [Anabrus simplex]|uniref:waprin-like protein n=1 Tax=Anabrus simplex TaxID=316456 RepID=UPI0034DCCBC3
MDFKIIVSIAALSVLLALVDESSAQIGSRAGHCPYTAAVKVCTPRCYNDFECSSGSKCCPNSCGTKSCAHAGAVSFGEKGNTASNVYCGDRKCSSSEKCGIDRSTKKEKCMPR